jgi:outer membrane porin, OprD family
VHRLNSYPQTRKTPSRAAALAVLWLWGMGTQEPVSSATTQAPVAVPAGSEDAAGSGTGEAAAPDSTEQGQTQLTDSFDHRPIAAMLHESSLVGLRDTTFNVQLRSFYLDRENFDTSESQAWTLGGSAGFKTGYFGDVVALGSTVFTSQRLYGPHDKDGTQLLETGQKEYTVIGELYGQFRLTDQIVATAGLHEIDTPFINTHDSLMTPNTFQLYAVQGTAGSTDEMNLRFGAGYVEKIKPRNSDDFQSMSLAAGAPAGVDRGVYVAGANFKDAGLSIGAIDYYSDDIINIFYSETKFSLPIVDRLSLRFGAQYTDQRSTGDNLLTGKPFSTDQYGLKVELALGPALLTTARTITATGTLTHDSGTDIRSPWGGYPGYTAVQIENFYRAGEDATLLRAAYNFPPVTGLSIYGLWVKGSTPQVANQYAQTEYDLNLKWIAASRTLKGLTLLARYGHVAQGGPSDQHENELRLVLYYQLR